MELHGQDYLIDYLQVVDPQKHAFSMQDLSTSSVNALRRSMVRIGAWPLSNSRDIELKYRNPIALSELSVLSISDIRDLRQVGEGKVIKLIDEMRKSILNCGDWTPSAGEDLGKPLASISEHELALEQSTNLFELTENMVNFLKAEFELQGLRDPRRITIIDERTEVIWRNRLSWLTDDPRTLDAIGKDFEVTRERIRQIQALSFRHQFPQNIQISLMNDIQEILLESSSSSDFMDTLRNENMLGMERISIGRVRFIALELGYTEIANDVEKAIYRWINNPS